jgi:hypothetical protein
MYRQTAKAKQCAAMRSAKERIRLESLTPEYPKELPELRKSILITNYDFGEEVHLFELMKSGRIDQYRVIVDGELWKERIGMSGILAGIRKSMPPVRAI